ncbi:hypothetical protein [Streptomyces sp. NBC_01294]|uniref:hypothetical protein n=1 Tax=Streptomyces sp. NBC_01294 TaxID=2903815 RepID=UPI002DD9250A|nr:hypothetical protein [Streptomyces sp. NBC_01294]WRZ62178.1 hypothetical protein OG534_37485 [Streptomyces sp. NBC_01294]
MHNPVAERDELTFGFGATDLGSSFHGDWVLYAETELDHITHWYGPEGGPTRLLLLIEDLLRLRDSGLDGEEINLLWRATDPQLGGSPEIRGQEREWLDRVLAWAVPVALARGASVESCTTYPVCVPDGTSAAAAEHRRLTAEVVDLVGLLNQHCESHTPLDATQAALRRCAETLCAELAFRSLLCAASHFSTQLSPATYSRLERLSTAFGYGPHVVDAVKYLMD